MPVLLAVSTLLRDDDRQRSLTFAGRRHLRQFGAHPLFVQCGQLAVRDLPTNDVVEVSRPLPLSWPDGRVVEDALEHHARLVFARSGKLVEVRDLRIGGADGVDLT